MADPTEVLRRPAPPPDVTLGYGDGPDHVIDLRLPPGPRARRPLVVVVHGSVDAVAGGTPPATPSARPSGTPAPSSPQSSPSAAPAPSAPASRAPSAAPRTTAPSSARPSAAPSTPAGAAPSTVPPTGAR